MTLVEEYIKRIKDSKLRAIVKKLRQIVLKSLPQAVESVKWGMPHFSIDGENIATIAEYTKYVNLYLFSGAKLSSKLLEGTGKGMRHITIRSVSDINEKEFSRLLRQAANLSKI